MTDSPQSRFRRFGQPVVEPLEPIPEPLPARGVDHINSKYTCKACGGPGHSARSNTCHMTVAERAEHRRQSGRRGKK